MDITVLRSKLPQLQISDLYITPRLLHSLLPQVGRLLGRGGAGEVYALQDERYVLKISDPCRYERTGATVHPAIQRYCEHMKDPTAIIHLPNDGKSMVIIPNFLLEGIIGLILSDLGIHTPHFARYYSVAVSPVELKSYVMIERLFSDLSTQINRLVDVYLLLFQVAQALSVAQEVYRFTHYDLHTGNLLYQQVAPGFYGYPFFRPGTKEGIIYIRNSGFMVKISDLGLARMETEDVIVNARVDNFPLESYGVFNSDYDFLSLIGDLFNLDGPIENRVRNLMSIPSRNELLSFLFREPISMGANEYYDYVRNKYYMIQEGKLWWRPKLNQYIDSPNIYDIITWLANKLIEADYASFDPPDRIETLFYPLINYTLLSDLQKRRVGVDLSPSVPHRSITVIPNIIVVHSFYLTYNVAPYPYNRTPSDRQIQSCPLQQHYVHVAYINSEQALNNGLSFKFLCCKLDPMNYMNDKIGIAINGSFFDIKKTYKAMGPYRQLIEENQYVETNLPISRIIANYDQFYGVIAIDDTGNLTIQSPDQLFYDDIMYSGPLLVYNRENVFPKGRLAAPWFQCKPDPRNPDKVIYPPFSDTRYVLTATGTCVQEQVDEKDLLLPNCDRIDPGELSHAANSNPRSMLIERDNSDGLGNLAFVVVEGRADRGDGMDLAQLAQLAVDLKAINAINLDGGRSSNMAWRSETEDVVYTVNPNKRYNYPVGDLIALTLD